MLFVEQKLTKNFNFQTRFSILAIIHLQIWQFIFINITLQENVIFIGDSVFEGCNELKTITVNSKNSHYKSNDSVLFNKDGNQLIRYLKRFGLNVTGVDTELVIKLEGYLNKWIANGNMSNWREDQDQNGNLPGIATANGKFNNKDDMINYKFPGNFEISTQKDFAGDNSGPLLPSPTTQSWALLRHSQGSQLMRRVQTHKVSIPSGVTTIQNFAFYECNSLISIILPDSVTIMGKFAFYRCSSLTSITLSGSLTTNGNSSFSE